MKIGMPVYQGVDLLDVAGPHEMFGWMNQGGEAEGDQNRDEDNHDVPFQFFLSCR